MVTLVGLSGLINLQIQHKQLASSPDLLIARTNARAAVELALSRIDSDSNWRNTYTNGIETTPQSLGANAVGTVSWILEDDDGNPAAPDTNLRLKGIGRVNNTVQALSIQISGTPTVLDVLECSTYAVNDATQSSNSTSNTGPFASGARMTVNGTVYGDAEGNPLIISGTGGVTGVQTSPGPNRDMPSSNVWDTYMALATTIPYTNFPLNDTNPNDRVIERQLLSGNVNPYGPYVTLVDQFPEHQCRNTIQHCGYRYD